MSRPSTRTPRGVVTASGSSRKSRLPFRRSNSNTNLTVPKNLFRRSQSSSSTCSTPNLTTPSSRRTKSPRPDRKSEEWLTLKAYLLAKNANIGTLYPASQSSFIAACNILFKDLEPRILLTKENYEEKITNYLKLYRYPYTITKTFFKTISAAHSWPNICRVWLWLYERGLKIRNPEIFIEHFNTESEHYMKKALIDFCYERYVADERLEEEEIKERLKLLRHAPGFNSVESIKVIHEELLEKHNAICEKENDLKSTIRMYEHSCDYYKEKKNHNEAEFERFYTSRDNFNEKLTKDAVVLKNTLEELETVIGGFKETLAKQKFSIDDHKELAMKREKMERALLLNQSKYKEYTNLINQQQLVTQTLDEKLQNSIYILNSKLQKLSLKIPAMKDVKISTQSVIEAKKDIDEIMQSLINFKTDLQSVNWNEKKYELQKVKKEVVDEIMGLKVEHKELELEVIELSHKHKESNSKASLLQQKYEEKCKEYEEIFSKQLNPTELKTELGLQDSQTNAVKEELKSYQRNTIFEMHNQLIKNAELCKQFNNETTDIMKTVLQKKKAKEAELLKARAALKKLQKNIKN